VIYKKMDKYLLGIDIGTSGCKSCVIDNKGKLIASACHEYSPLITRGRWVEQGSDRLVAYGSIQR